MVALEIGSLTLEIGMFLVIGTGEHPFHCGLVMILKRLGFNSDDCYFSVEVLNLGGLCGFYPRIRTTFWSQKYHRLA